MYILQQRKIPNKPYEEPSIEETNVIGYMELKFIVDIYDLVITLGFNDFLKLYQVQYQLILLKFNLRFIKFVSIRLNLWFSLLFG